MSWTERFRGLAHRNRPSRKPQLWEDFSLSLRRRLRFEIMKRANPGWLETTHVVHLSDVGFRDQGRSLAIGVVPREMTNQAMFLYGTFEIAETRLVQAYLTEGMTFVDVGANIGYYSLVASRLVGPTGAVHSFEPSASVRSRLLENVQRNRLTNVLVHEEAMTSTTGEVDFYASSVDENQGISSILPGHGRVLTDRVRAISLDDFTAGRCRARINLVKIDIEGAELQVLEGGYRTLRLSDAPALVFEAFDLGPVRSALEKLGYRVRRVHYTLANGLELPEPEESGEDLFSGYEAPNYFAAKGEETFARVLERANSDRSRALRMLALL